MIPKAVHRSAKAESEKLIPNIWQVSQELCANVPGQELEPEHSDQ